MPPHELVEFAVGAAGAVDEWTKASQTQCETLLGDRESLFRVTKRNNE